MPKWMKLLLLGLVGTTALGLAIMNYSDELEFSLHGKIAKINPDIVLSVEKRQDTKKESILASMSYVDQEGKVVKFRRYLPNNVIRELKNGKSIYVEYIPNEWNSERIHGQKAHIGVFVLAFLACVIGFTRVLRKPSAPDAAMGYTPLWMAWLIRVSLLMLAIGGTLGGGLGLLSSRHGVVDAVLLVVGIVFLWIFIKSLKMR
jgi:hypothetical protein